ncbi:MAG: phosphate ABC transporter permease PstA [Acidimicrobiales bacterium]
MGVTLDHKMDLGPEPLPQIKVDRKIVAAVAVSSTLAGVVISLLLMGRFSIAMTMLLSFIMYLISIYALTRKLEDAREASNKLMAGVVTGSFALIVFPLVSVLWTVVSKGAARFDTMFFSESLRNVLGDGGGGQHAIAGTLIVTGIAAVLSVPIGIMVAVYLVEYGRGPLAKAVTRMVDVMTGIPSIVAGLFAYALFVLFTGPGHRSGMAGGVALAVLMMPIVVRTSEEMLRLVPNELREASYALGVTKWRTIVKVVIPTAIAGILTGVTLAIARVVGETAPLLVTAGLADSLHTDPFSGRMTTLATMAYYSYKTPGVPPQASYDRGWTAALVLVLIVALLFAIARLLARVLKPKGLR